MKQASNLSQGTQLINDINSKLRQLRALHSEPLVRHLRAEFKYTDVKIGKILGITDVGVEHLYPKQKEGEKKS